MLDSVFTAAIFEGYFSEAGSEGAAARQDWPPELLGKVLRCARRHLS